MRVFASIAAVLLLGGCILEERNYGPPPITKAELISMHSSGVSEGDMVQLLERNGLPNPMSADDVVDLQKAGMSDAVIVAAVKAPIRMPPQRVVHYYRPAPVYCHPADVVVAGAVTAGLVWHWSRFWRCLR